ncbi:hypothetical protein N7474_005490 [Penicillium riverlandense]|uniref:uncharacterized protein n=1 Tax=Penicillium riverlandense TaxID=1903569 RepID=UPI002546AAAB|nr:uncharacterized protein N7474_005490 [Penicillium riverlandense]KAJ5819899.1 hypothetical protein N7474_005490 [Penicillium riverlandense]
MESHSPASTRVDEHEPEWQYGPRAKRQKRASTTGTTQPSPREIGYMRESQHDGSASFIGSSSGIHFIRHVYDAFARRSADLHRSRVRDRCSVPGEDDRLRSVGADELWSNQELDFSEISNYSFDDLARWTHSYFEHWHPIFPFLHAPTVLTSMEKASQSGIEALGRIEMIILRSVVSISLGDSRQSGTAHLGRVPSTLVFRTVRHMMQDIQSLLSESTTLPLLQAAFSIQLVLVSLLRLNIASRVGGTITRSAFHLGLHRCPGRFSCFRHEEANIRRRLFWSIYCLERYLSQALGIPLAIRDDDIDVCYPGEETHTTATSRTDGDHRLRLLCHLAKFARIRGLVVELRNKSILHSHPNSLEAARVNGEMSQWWNEVYDDVYPVDDDGDTPSLQLYHRSLLIILKNEAIISMNRPLLAAEKPSPEYKNALQTCIESSRSLLLELNRYRASASREEQAGSDAPLSWPSFTWATWMACLILMYASWEGDFPVPLALKYAKMGIRIFENLALRGSGWPETCIEAIKGMESALLTSVDSSKKSQNAVILSNHQSNLQSVERLDIPTLRENRGGSSGSQGDLPGGAQLPETSVTSPDRGVGPAQPFNSVVLASQTNAGDSSVISDLTNHGFSLSGYTSAGLVFGNTADREMPFCPWAVGEDSTPFPDSSVPDLWSVADAPWMIHENFL